MLEIYKTVLEGGHRGNCGKKIQIYRNCASG